MAIVMGAEDTGVSMDNLRICDSMVKIPQFGTIGSLNVSVEVLIASAFTVTLPLEGITIASTPAHSQVRAIAPKFGHP